MPNPREQHIARALRERGGAATMPRQLEGERAGGVGDAAGAAGGDRGGVDADVRAPLVIIVLGIPAPKGSAQAFYNAKTQRAHVVTGGSKVTREKMRSWDGAVREAVHHKLGHLNAPLHVKRPLEVEIVFGLARIAGHWGTGKRAGELKPNAPRYPIVKPDIDKLARATLDAMTGSVFSDDSCVARLTCTKVYADPGHEGATITVRSLG